MTCTVTAKVPDEDMKEVAEGNLSVPLSAVGSAADTTSFVWRLDANGNGTYTVRRASVVLGGLIVLQEGMSMLGVDEFTVSESDILQGIVMDACRA